ncbi:GntR family transcriptional regulator [Streptomyces alboflavus]|uniref:GntR family transcriptional regulator n=1 Tax=Streptomyces alboflavus TaxID=67267 RepID=A0A1Z1WDM0_9ACTN|nr:GntR family transcriptional regulator [Streptomyces alboflavus]
MATRRRAPGEPPSKLEEVRQTLTELQPRLTRWLLGGVAALSLAAELFEPLGNALKSGEFLSTTYVSVISLVLFNAISDSGATREADGVEVFDTVDAISDPVKEAFDERHVHLYFFGFTTETLYSAVKEPLIRLRDETSKTRELTLRIIIVSLNSPMSLPGSLTPAPDGSGIHYFADSPENRRRMRNRFAKEYWGLLKDLLDRVHTENAGVSITCELRESPHTPVSKLYILNKQKVYYGTYGIMRKKVRHGRRHRELDILDAEGFGIRHGPARLIGWDKEARTRSTKQIAEFHMAWFQNLWGVLENIRPRDAVFSDTDRVWRPPPH